MQIRVLRQPYLTDCLAYLIQLTREIIFRQTVEQQKKLISAVAYQLVSAAQHKADGLRNTAQRLVSRRMSEGVVYMLEIIYVYHGDRLLAGEIAYTLVVIAAVKYLSHRVYVYLTVAYEQLT